MSLYLIRHGETAGNRERIVQVPQTPLCERGRAQASRLATRLRGSRIVRILASDLPRALETAESVAGAVGVAVELEPLLRERDFGEIRGTAYADLGLDPFAPGYTPAGGESWADFHARVDRVCRRITEVHREIDGDLAVVTHGLVCHSLFARHVRPPDGETAPPADGPPLRFGNTALSILSGRRPPWRAELVACTAHLDAPEQDDSGGVSGL